MKILITGGLGYIGGHVARRLLKDGHDVTSIDRCDSGAPYFNVDVCDEAALDRLFNSRKFDAVCHLAALISAPESILGPEAYWKVNFGGTFNLLKVMRRHSVNKIIFSSTAAVYQSDSQPVGENSKLEPITPYGQSKLAAEYLIKSYAVHGIDHVIFRYFNVAGADEDYWGTPKQGGIMAALLNAVNGLGEFEIFGASHITPDGTCWRDYIHVEDIADAHSKALNHPAANNHTFNLGTGRPYSVMEILNMARQVTGHPIPCSVKADRPGDPFSVYAFADRAASFGWKAKHDLRSIVESTFKRRQPYPAPLH